MAQEGVTRKKHGGERGVHKAEKAREAAAIANLKRREDVTLEAADDAGEQTSDAEDGVDVNDVLQRTTLDLSGNPMPPIKGLIGTLSRFVHLQRLDMSGMKPSTAAGNPDGLSRLDWLAKAAKQSSASKESDASFGDKLNWLKITDNPGLGKTGGSEIWTGISGLTSLTVLNTSSCALSVAPPASSLLRLTSLGALILAHNNITTLSTLPYLPNLNTLVLSHNKITNIPKDLPPNLPALKKLSITQNALEWSGDVSPLPDFTVCSHLREVRVSGNSRLKKLPSHLSTWGRGEGSSRLGTGIETLEAADCGLDSWSSIDAVLRMTGTEGRDRKRPRGLGNLNLRGNKVAQSASYRQRMADVHVTLRTLDGEKLVLPKQTAGEEDDLKKQIQATAPSEDDVKTIDESEKFAETRDRKRGKRGSGKVKQRASDEIDIGSGKSKSRSSEVTSRKAESSDADARRMKSRAGPAPSEVSKKNSDRPPKTDKPPKKRSRQEDSSDAPLAHSVDREKDKERKKRKAWDDSEVIPSSETQHAPPSGEERSRQRTSIAAVVQVGPRKHQSDSTKADPIWTSLGVTNDAVGTGNAWG